MKEKIIPYEESLAKLQAHGYVRVGQGHSATSEAELRRVYGFLKWPFPALTGEAARLSKELEDTKAQLEEAKAAVETIVPTSSRGLDALTLEGLQTVAKGRGLEVPEGTTKAQLVELLTAKA